MYSCSKIIKNRELASRKSMMSFSFDPNKSMYHSIEYLLKERIMNIHLTYSLYNDFYLHSTNSSKMLYEGNMHDREKKTKEEL